MSFIISPTLLSLLAQFFKSKHRAQQVTRDQRFLNACWSVGGFYKWRRQRDIAGFDDSSVEIHTTVVSHIFIVRSRRLADKVAKRTRSVALSRTKSRDYPGHVVCVPLPGRSFHTFPRFFSARVPPLLPSVSSFYFGPALPPSLVLARCTLRL